MEKQFQLDWLSYGEELSETPLNFNGCCINLSKAENPLPLTHWFDPWKELWEVHDCSSMQLVPYYHSQFQSPLNDEQFFDFDSGFGLWEDVFKGGNQVGFGESVAENVKINSTSEISNDLNKTLVEINEVIELGTVKKIFTGRLKSSSIGFEEISRHFYMPITHAAKELKVGLTVLKKMCREFGITRWPYRKIKSLGSLIQSVQELGVVGGVLSEDRLRSEVENLEEQKRLMEKLPEMQLPEKTKKLRQACFKANYKKRRIMGSAK